MDECKCAKPEENSNAARLMSFKKDYQWTIPNYLDWATTAKEKEESPIFQLSRGASKAPCLLSIRIYPKGDTKNNTDALQYLTVYLVNKSDFEAIIDYKLYIELKNGNRQDLVAGKQRTFAPGSSGIGVGEAWGNRKAVKLSVLEDSRQDYLPNGSLIVGCVVTITVPSVFVSTGLENNLRQQNTFTQGMIEQFDASNPESGNNYKWLSDFEIQCGQDDGKGSFVAEKTFNCHKIILSLRSPVFKDMFSSLAKETIPNNSIPCNKVAIRDVSADTMEKMLQFIYTDNIKISVNDTKIDELLYAADKYQLGRLRSICERTLAGKLDDANAAEIAIASHMYGSKAFKKEVVKYIAENWAKLKEKKEAEKIMDHPDLVDEMLSYLTS